ncbi:unnamed protein product [Adineta steineri]|uniref:Uncharacterized protein n=1 Tax=Adineta steineri TaxID=433720 RepID=A0A815I628_9BILA|nr:unnamed protein product [Adineta steineri]CAF1600355.1 unnamed protein product [Adineta steineri]
MVDYKIRSSNIQKLYFSLELFIVFNTIRHLFYQDQSITDIGYWFNMKWVVLPDYLSHYKREVLIVHFFSGMIALFGMRYQTSGSHKTNSLIHKYVGYIVVLNQLLVHSPTILMMTQYVKDYVLARKIFYIMTTIVTIKNAIMLVKYAREKNMRKHRRCALTLYNYISTFTKGRIYMYTVLPFLPNNWRPFHIFISDVVSIAFAERYSWKRMAKLFVIIFISGQLIELTPSLWYIWAFVGITYNAIYA